MNPKKLAAEKAVTSIKEGMTVGLGTGSTAAFAIDAIGAMVKEGLSIRAVASSLQSERLATKAGITLVPFSDVASIDLYIDGADEVDPAFNLVKGGGGALLREKILAFHSKEFIVIVDRTKLVDQLGTFPLPVEVTPFAEELTTRQLEKLGCRPSLRMQDQTPFQTDNGNHIIDCRFGAIDDVVTLDRLLQSIPGVVENGLFLHSMVSRVVVGDENGEVKVMERIARD